MGVDQDGRVWSFINLISFQLIKVVKIEITVLEDGERWLDGVVPEELAADLGDGDGVLDVLNGVGDAVDGARDHVGACVDDRAGQVGGQVGGSADQTSRAVDQRAQAEYGRAGLAQHGHHGQHCHETLMRFHCLMFECFE